MSSVNSDGQPHICVVGAGISGLRCADILLQHGFRVTILEARDRIGGRICQSDKLGYASDIGPNWIHATGGPHPIRDLAIQTKTPLHHWNSKQDIYAPSGELLPEAKSSELSTLLWEIIEEAFQYSEKNPSLIPEAASLYDFISQKVKEKLPDREEDHSTILNMSEMWGAYTGHPVTRQSLRFAWMEECCGGDEMFIETTYEAIFDKIAELPRANAEIRLEEKVVKIIRPADRNAGPITLLTEKGDQFSFDEVLMTTPLGWLKMHQEDAFTPALPIRLCSAINAISVGYLEKVFITFPSAFWVKGFADEDCAGYTNWLSPSYAQETNPKCWSQEIWNLAAFSSENRRPTILFYLYGDCSQYLVNLVHGKSTEEHYSLLDTFFRPYYSRLPNFSSEDENCRPQAILSTQWQKDELSGFGSYCNFQVGIVEADEDVKKIRRGCPEQRLWFAGEHTAPFEELGTAAGAYMSGEAVARRIAEIYEK